MNPLYIRVFVLVLLFAAVILTIEGIAGWLRARATTDRVVNRRLKMIAAGFERSTVLSKLRRSDEAVSFDRSRSEEHTSELQSLMRISYAVFCLKKKNKNN